MELCKAVSPSDERGGERARNKNAKTGRGGTAAQTDGTDGRRGGRHHQTSKDTARIASGFTLRLTMWPFRRIHPMLAAIKNLRPLLKDSR